MMLIYRGREEEGYRQEGQRKRRQRKIMRRPIDGERRRKLGRDRRKRRKERQSCIAHYMDHF